MPPFESARELGEAIRAARERCGISLREFARRTGLSAAFISDVERGAIRSPVNEETIIHMAEVLGASNEVDTWLAIMGRLRVSKLAEVLHYPENLQRLAGATGLSVNQVAVLVDGTLQRLRGRTKA